LSGEKTLEIRDQGCPSKVGEQIWLCASGSAEVTGRAVVSGCGALNNCEWEKLRPQHLVEGGRPYGNKTNAWHLTGVQRIPAIPIQRKRGSVIWQTGPGG
jgi:hypothetical protein